jgi:hypothetical protein
MLDALTPHAFDARLAQLTGKGFAEYEFDFSEVRGSGVWTAFFEVEREQDCGEWLRLNHAVLSVTLMGAWREDEDGNVFCGNRDEITAIVGAKEVARWEAHITDRESEK